MTNALGFMEAARIQSEINRLFENLLGDGKSQPNAGDWVPNADVLETKDHLILKVELPGVVAKDVRLTMDSGNVIIEGQKPRPVGLSKDRLQRSERSFGPFHRVVSLGLPVNTRLAEAVLKDGLLRVTFPKVPNRRGEVVQIEVKAS